MIEKGVNEEVREEWKKEKSTFQRVKSVVSRIYDAKSASEIADRALVSETTARTHLEDLAEEGVVETETNSGNGATLYKRSWESLTLEQAQDIRNNTDSDELLDRVHEMQEEIKECREKSGVDSPEDIAWEDADLDREEIMKWKTTRRNLGFAKVALALDQAASVVGDPTTV